MSEPTDKTLQQNFYTQFQASRTSLAARLDALKSNAPSHNDWQALALDIRRLGKSLTDATSFLSGYDQRLCLEQLSILEQTLEEIRSASAPKTRFTFKRKADKPVLSAAQTLLPSSSGKDELEENNGVVGTSTVHKLSSHSNSRLFLRSIPTLGTGPQPSDLTISDLDCCIVDLCGAADTMPHQNQLCLTALHVHNLKDTVLILPNVEGSVLLYHLYRCTVIVGCHQFRLHNSSNVRVYLAAVSNPVIENCSTIAFAEYPSFLSQRNPSVNVPIPPNGKHANVQDFSHIRPTPSPNWSLLRPEDNNWDDLRILDESSPQGLGTILAKHLPEAMSGDTT